MLHQFDWFYIFLAIPIYTFDIYINILAIILLGHAGLKIGTLSTFHCHVSSDCQVYCEELKRDQISEFVPFIPFLYNKKLV